jgi:hypothetical protein
LNAPSICIDGACKEQNSRRHFLAYKIIAFGLRDGLRYMREAKSRHAVKRDG